MPSLQAFFSDAALPFFDLISDMGTGAPFVILLLTVFLLFGTRVGLRAGLLYSVASYLTFLSKWVIAAPRPYFIDHAVTAHSLSTGYGMPSGHAAQTSAGLWPVIVTRKGWLLSAVVILFVLLVALSRVYLGVHFPAQVFAGLALGTAVFALGSLLENAVVGWLKSLSFPVQAGLILMPFVVFFAVDRAVLSNLPEEIPATWQAGYDRAVEARGAALGFGPDSPEVTERKGSFTLTEPRSNEFYAALFGWLLVALAAIRFGGFAVSGWRHGLTNLGVGGALLGGLYAAFFVVLDIEDLQLILIAVAPLICAVLVPKVTQRWWPGPLSA